MDQAKDEIRRGGRCAPLKLRSRVPVCALFTRVQCDVKGLYRGIANSFKWFCAAVLQLGFGFDGGLNI